ncbi:MAG: hypothetical protein C4294_09525, partial [Nitrospiraceae bacterium]
RREPRHAPGDGQLADSEPDALGPQVSLIGAGAMLLLTALVIVYVSKHYGFPTLLEEPVVTP